MAEHIYISIKSYNKSSLQQSPPVQVPAWAAVVAEHRPHVETLVTENNAPINNLGSAKPQQERLFCARTRLRMDSKEFPMPRRASSCSRLPSLYSHILDDSCAMVHV